MNKRDDACKYAEKVLSGEIVANRKVKRNCETFLRTFEAIEGKKAPNLRYNNEVLRQFYKFSPHLRHFEGITSLIGKSAKWELWQKYIFANIYGLEIYDEELNEWTWLHREVFIFCAKKQGKSFMSSGIELFDCGYILDEGAKCFIFGSDGNTARIPFENCAKFIESDEDLSEDFSRVGNHIYTNWDRSSSIQLIPKMSKTGNFDGKNVFSALCEEVHTFNDEGATYDIFARGVSARSKAHLISITTAGYDKFSFCKRQYDLFSDVNERGDIYSPKWGILYELDEDDDDRDPQVWVKANPNLGVSKRRSYIADCIKEIELQPSKLNQFLTKEMNVWVDNVEAWLDSDKVAQCFVPMSAAEILRGKKCFVGVDLARKRDLSGVTAIFPEQDGLDKTYILSRGFIDEGTADKRTELSKVPFREWAKAGYLTLTPGEEIDFEEIEEYILTLRDKYRVERVYYDPTFAAVLMDKVSKSGIETKEFRQNGYNYSEVVNAFELAVEAGKVAFVENECLRWCLYNTQMQRFNDDRVMPYKKGDENKKIDLAVATLIGYKGLCETGEKKKPSRAAEAYLLAKGYYKDEEGNWKKANS